LHKSFLSTLFLLMAILMICAGCTAKKDYDFCRYSEDMGICEGRYYNLKGIKTYTVTDKRIIAYNPVRVGIEIKVKKGKAEVSVTAHEGTKTSVDVKGGESATINEWVETSNGTFEVKFEAKSAEAVEIYYGISYQIPAQ
jgi:hypothetical protein